jgi:hypothetical protein
MKSEEFIGKTDNRAWIREEEIIGLSQKEEGEMMSTHSARSKNNKD